MSLEAKIDELNANLSKLIVLLANPAVVAPISAPVKPAAPTAAPSQAAADSAKAAAVPAAAQSPAPKPEASPAPLDYTKDVQPKLLEVSAKKGREALVALLGKFGVKKGTEIPAERWQEAIDAAKAAVA